MQVARPLRLVSGSLLGWQRWFTIEAMVLIAVFGFIALASNPPRSGPGSGSPGSNNSNLWQICPVLPCPTTPVTSTTPVTTTKSSTVPSNSAIGGTIFLDGVPAAGFQVKLDDTGMMQTTGGDGHYNFTNLREGFYVVRVINYDSTKVKPVGQDFSNQTMTGSDVQTAVNFQFVSIIATTKVPTTAPTSVPPTTRGKPTLDVNPKMGPAGTLLQITGSGWNPNGPNGPNSVTVVANASAGSAGGLSGFSLNQNAPLATLGTFPVNGDGTIKGQANLPALSPGAIQLMGSDLNGEQAQTPFTVQAQATPQCPNVASGKGLRLAVATNQKNATTNFFCMQVIAGEDGVNLSDTIVITFPDGSNISEVNAGLGTTSVSGNTIRWGGFSLASRQSTNLILSVANSSGSLANSSIFVSGRFNRGQSFQQRIPGLPALTEIDIPAQGGGNVVPQSPPSTGVGQPNKEDSTGAIIVIAGLIGLWLAALGFLIKRSPRRDEGRRTKENP